MRAALALAVVLLAAPSSAQTLPHNIPDLCALDPSCTVVPAGTARTLANETHTTLGVRGAITITGRLRVFTILCYPGGSVTFADGSETAFMGGLFHASDPEQWAHGMVADGCTVRAQGRTPTPFIRLLVEPLAGATTLTLATVPVDWRVGDRLVLPDTRQLDESNRFVNVALQHEVRTIAAINGATVTLNAPLTFNHRGAKDANGSPRLLPHVGHLTRSITIRSENPSGVRGHLAFLGRSTVDLRGVEVDDLGRTTVEPTNTTTNIIGRYPVHFHHLPGPLNPTNTGYQFVFEGNVIEGGLKWPLAIHNTHYGLAKGNVIYGAGNLTGSGIALEDGSETDNLIEENFLVDIRGNKNPRETLPFMATQGSGGDCIWGAGFNNRFVNNVLAGCRNTFQGIVSGTGFKLGTHAAPRTNRIPRFRGADTSDTTQTVAVTVQHQPILEMRGNEVYGLAAAGMTVWHLGTDGGTIQPATMNESLVKDFVVWHTYDGVYWGYPSNRLTFDGTMYRSEKFMIDGGPQAFTAGDYRAINLTIRNADIHAGSVLRGFADPVGTMRLEQIRATTRGYAFQFGTPSTPGTGTRNSSPGKHPLAVELVSPQITAWPNQPLRTISMQHASSTAPPNDPYSPFTVTVTNYQNTGAALQVYFAVQATTSQFYGGQAPAGTTTLPEINGLVFTGVNPPPPPPPPQEICGNGIDDDGDGQIDEGCTPPPPPPPPPCSVFDWTRTVTVTFTIDPVTKTISLLTFTDANGCKVSR